MNEIVEKDLTQKMTAGVLKQHVLGVFVRSKDLRLQHGEITRLTLEPITETGDIVGDVIDFFLKIGFSEEETKTAIEQVREIHRTNANNQPATAA